MLSCITAMEAIMASIRPNAASDPAPEERGADVVDASGGGTDEREPKDGCVGNAANEAKGGRGTDIKGPANDKRRDSEEGASEDNTEGVGSGTDAAEEKMVWA